MLKIAQIIELVLNNGKLSQSSPYMKNVIGNLSKIILFGMFAILMFVGLMGFGFSYIYLSLIHNGAPIYVALSAIIIPIILMMVIAILIMRNIWLETTYNIAHIFSFQVPIGDQIQNIAHSFLRGLLSPNQTSSK
jgi:hypothetical protein